MSQVSLETLDDVYDLVVLAPHLDDAALSCGGLITQRRQRDQRVLVLTICTAAPAPAGPFNAVAQEFHAQWNLSAEQVVAARLAEERAAMAMLDVDYCWAGRLDAIYRQPDAYVSRDTLFALPVHHDPLAADLHNLFAGLYTRLPRARFVAPLAIGSHVDHHLTYGAAYATLADCVQFYEDTPYVYKTGALELRLAELAAETLGCQTSTFDAAATARKIAGIAAYASQMHELFGGVAAMEAQVRAAALALGNGQSGERLWSITR